MIATVAPPFASFSSARLACSPLNPNSSLHCQSNSNVSINSSTKTHLANLNRVLNKPDLLQSQNKPIEPQKLKQIHDNQNYKDDDNNNESGFLANTLNHWFRNPLVTEETTISPRSLIQLKRLLSDSSRPSPKTSIASKWRQLHGSNSWSGLLDPLDENLRRELIWYGELVQAAYQAFPTSTSSKQVKILLPNRSYRVTKSLYATSSLHLPEWVKSTAPPLLTQRSSWIGYVAVCDNEREIRRIGRREIVIALRGTSTCLEWAENLRTKLENINTDNLMPTKHSSDGTESENNFSNHIHEQRPKVSKGFLNLYKTAGADMPSLSESVVDEVRRLLDIYKDEELSITVTGHSLGAALAVLVADELGTCAAHVPPIAVVSFGGPRVGNKAFVDRVNARKVNVLRVVNENDVVTRVPGAVGMPHVTEGYEHVGTELRVNNRASPYLRPDAGLGCCHDLEAYLHLVDGFLGTGLAFRSDAKRSLVRLMELQRSNVKQVYVNRARDLRVRPVEVAVPFRSSEHGCLASP